MKITDKTTVKELKEHIKKVYYQIGCYSSMIKIMKVDNNRIYYNVEKGCFESNSEPDDPLFTYDETIDIIKKYMKEIEMK